MQQTGRARRRWGATVVGSLAAVALAAGCTGDEGVQVVTEGADSAAALAAAVDATPTSGRFRYEMTMDLLDPSDDAGTWSMATTAEGEFVAENLRVRTTTTVDGQEMAGDGIVVDGRQFQSADSLLESFASPGDDEMAEALAAQRASMEAALAGKQWVESEALEMDVESLGEDGDSLGLGALFLGGPSSLLTDPAELLEDIDGVREVDPVDRDGDVLRRFIGEVGRGGLFGGTDEDSGRPPEEQARIDRIDEYMWSHTESTVEVLVGSDGFIRRVHFEISDDVEEQYRDCGYLSDQGAMSLTVELSELGEPMEITAPDPSTVIDMSEVTGTAGSFDGGDNEGHAPGDPVTPTAIYGREFANEMLVEGAPLIGLDPATIPSLSDEEVDAALDQVDAATAALPNFDTRLGPQNRPEMVDTIRMGTEMLGIEPLDLSTYSDQQLADLINTFIDENGMDFGVGGGDEFEYEDDPDYDEFEGCPA